MLVTLRPLVLAYSSPATWAAPSPPCPCFPACLPLASIPRLLRRTRVFTPAETAASAKAALTDSISAEERHWGRLRNTRSTPSIAWGRVSGQVTSPSTASSRNPSRSAKSPAR